MFYLTALAIGFLGSFHCVGMCGPIALALPVSSKRITGRVLYNAGRIVTYALMGLLFGLLGRTLVIAGFEKNLSIIAGATIFIIAVVQLSPTDGGKRWTLLLNRFTNKLKQAFRNLFGRRSLLSFFLIGTVNGLLPCGFVYIALVTAAAGGTAANGFFYMAMFGLGTLPMMLSLSLAGQLFGIRFQLGFKKASPYIAAAVAVFLIYRGVSYSPHACCHH